MRETRTKTVLVRDGQEVTDDDDIYSFHDPNHKHWQNVPDSEFREMGEEQARAIGCTPCQHCYDIGKPFAERRSELP